MNRQVYERLMTDLAHEHNDLDDEIEPAILFLETNEQCDFNEDDEAQYDMALRCEQARDTIINGVERQKLIDKKMHHLEAIHGQR